MAGGDPQFSFAAPLDTGSSGCVLAYYMANGRNLPLVTGPGSTYSDVGIGGTEIFNVSRPTQLKIASVALGADSSENVGSYASAGNYNFQVRQKDPNMNIEGFQDPVYVNVIGTPVLNKYTMHVQTNGNTFPYYVDGGIDLGIGFNINVCPVNYLETDLLPSTPTGLGVPPGASQLVLVRASDHAALHVPLTYQNFVTDPAPPVSTSTNPTIAGVALTINSSATPYVSDWLFDTGAAVTMIGRTLASDLGLLSETPTTSTTILGIGGEIRTINGYPVDSLTVPLADGGHLIFNNIVVFVPNDGDLPADLPGIFGMNLLDDSFSDVDPDTGEFDNLTTSAFSDWYVIPGSPTTIPEPSALVLLAIGAAMFLLRRYARRRQ